MLPDVDVVSTLVSRWEYFSAAWYGHRMASHSFLGSLILAAAAAALLYPLLARGRPSRSSTPVTGGGSFPDPRAYGWLLAVMWAGCLLHITGDFFTPGMPMPLLWPGAMRYGALAHIGWFSPYLLLMFLIVVGTEAGLATLRRFSAQPWRARLATASWGLHTLAALRWMHYLAVSRYHSPNQWQAYQNDLLPEAVVGPLNIVVYTVWHWLTR
jgi:membrane-bound metal-dependent hydrolase YbcI (DUF457 family)